jgi:hypothetical protein
MLVAARASAPVVSACGNTNQVGGLVGLVCKHCLACLVEALEQRRVLKTFLKKFTNRNIFDPSSQQTHNLIMFLS